jgi:hypothetical protein
MESQISDGSRIEAYGLECFYASRLAPYAMVFTRCYWMGFFHQPGYCLTLMRVNIPAREKSRVGVQAATRGGRTPDFPKEIKM